MNDERRLTGFLVPPSSDRVLRHNGAEMPYHVMIWPQSSEQQKLRELYAMNIDEGDLRERIIVPYEEGRPITWAGRTLPAGDFGTITITYTDAEQSIPRHDEYEVLKRGADVTNDWIQGPPGQLAATDGEDDDAALRSPKRVMVVHGRNLETRNAMFTFLRAIGLEPIEWDEAIAQTGMGSPHNLEAVSSAMCIAQAVVVVLTAEDRAGLLPSLAKEGEALTLMGQPRQNVILEAGLAMGLNPGRTILVELGPIRRATDFEGLNTVRLTNDAPTRASLRSRLKNAGCDVADGGSDWMGPESGGNFDSYVQVDSSELEGDAVAAGTPYARAAQLQRDHRVARFLEMHDGVDQPFAPGELAEAMEEPSCDEVWAKEALEILETEGRVYRDRSGVGWYPGASDSR